MMKSPIVKLASLAAWLITAISAINVGLFQINQGFVFPDWVNYVIGISGLISLLLMIMMFTCGCWCDRKGCSHCHPEGHGSCGCGNKNCDGSCFNKTSKNGFNSNKPNQLKTCAVCGKPFGMCGCVK